MFELEKLQNDSKNFQNSLEMNVSSYPGLLLIDMSWFPKSDSQISIWAVLSKDEWCDYLCSYCWIT